ncbi:UbiE family methyltransferase [Sphaerosporella brunnea]|uniref:UbiE family methyltransferase n=1 Tax=Sphaerosporella brunnea TaxID=1250544 RepID=A0A5J5ERC5_9PEZI|nr:UbiE family methyltransferase [Sphaerosporella brunnea]
MQAPQKQAPIISTSSKCPDQVYIQGHNEAVLKSHRWRTAANSASYLLPTLRSSTKLLDVGCGPGTMTCDFARLCPDGHITGLDYSASVLAAASAEAASQALTNVAFTVGDIRSLPFPDDTFDVVHAHQVLQHLSDPVHALREMRRVARPGGVVAVRESDWAAFTWWPQTRGMREWHALHAKVARAHGCEPDAGRRLHVWAKEAGFERDNITPTAGTWCWNTPEERQWFGSTMGGRLLEREFRGNAEKCGATEEDLLKCHQAWKDWAEDEDGWFAILHGQVLCKK